MQTVEDIRRLIDEGRFRYALEPISASSGLSAGEPWYQWLARPDFGRRDFDPATFQEAVESLGMSLALDRRSVADALSWLGGVGRGTRLTVQISGAAVSDRDFLNQLVSQLERHGVDAGQLCFDLAVHAALSDLSGATRFVKTMRRSGARITLYNGIPGNPVLGLFGPLGYINHLKVDRMWVVSAPDSPSHLETLESIVDYAKRLGLPVIAEGVDSERHRELVAQLGVDYHQGMVNGLPMVVAESESAEASVRRIA